MEWARKQKLAEILEPEWITEGGFAKMRDQNGPSDPIEMGNSMVNIHKTWKTLIIEISCRYKIIAIQRGVFQIKYGKNTPN